MTHYCARLIAVAIAAVSFSPPITAQQEQAPSPTTLEALVETLGGRVSQNEQGELEALFLGGTQVTDAGLVHLAGLSGLKYLNLDDHPITDAGLAHLAGLTALEELNLSYSRQVTDAGLVHLAGLTALEEIDLSYSQVTAAGLVHFQKMPALRQLGLSGYLLSDLFTDADLANLREALPNVGIDDGAPPPPLPPPPQ